MKLYENLHVKKDKKNRHAVFNGENQLTAWANEAEAFETKSRLENIQKFR